MRADDQIQTEESLKKCLINTKAYRHGKIKKPTNLQKIFRNRYQKRSVYYFTSGRNIDSVLPDKNENPFKIPRKIDDFKYRTKFREGHKEFRESEKHYNHFNRPSYRSRLARNKLLRIHVPEANTTTLPGKSITEDIDSEFFTVVAGRPIREFFNPREYVKDLRTLFLLRLETGYKYDSTYLIEEQHREEQKRLKDVQNKFQTYSESYEKFLAEDHSSSMEMLMNADVESRKSKVKLERIKQLHKEVSWYHTNILILDEKWRRSKIYQKFLFQISPLWWREKYDYIHKTQATGVVDTSDTSIFGTNRVGTAASIMSILTIIDQFLQDATRSEPPELYFENPTELEYIFYELEKSNLLALLQCEELTPPAQQMMEGLEKAKLHFQNEVKILREYLRNLEEEVTFEENRVQEYKDKAKAISLGLFKSLIVDKSTLNLYVNVEDCYEVCVAPNDSNLSLSMMMKGIEQKQESLMVALDYLPNDIVVKAFQTCYKEDAKIMKEAQEATKMITQIENLMKTLRKSLEPTMVERTRKLNWRSEPPTEKMEMAEAPKPPTKDQINYLYFFTDMCPTPENLEAVKEMQSQRRASNATKL